MTAHPIQQSFNTGEVSPRMAARLDLPKRGFACETLENMLVYALGPTFRRPGTYYIGETKSSGQVVLMPFIFSNTDAYILEVGIGYIRFYRNGGQILDAGSAYEISTSYTASDLYEIQHEQTQDWMYLVHNDYWPQKLTRSGHTSWAIADIGTQDGPFMPENITDVTITPSGVTGNITVTASAATFNADHVGALWRLTQNRDSTEISGQFNHPNVTGQSATIAVEKGSSWKANTHGDWTGTIYVERSYDAGASWEQVGSGQYRRSGNLAVTGTESQQDALYRINLTAHSWGWVNYNFVVDSYAWKGVVQITAFTSTTVVTATVLKTLQAVTATKRWSEGAWSPYQGHPSAITFFQQRLALASSGHRLPRLWLSKSFEFDNFLEGDEADDSLSYALATARQDPVMWLADHRSIIIGTSGAEHSFGAPGGEGAITPGEFETFRQDTVGSKQIQPVTINNMTISVERGGKNLRQMGYSFQDDGYVNENLSILAEHLTEDTTIIGIAVQRRPQTIIWACLDDGTLLSVTYNRIHNVLSWSPHPMINGSVESVAVIPGSNEDEVWLIVNRTIEGSTKRYVEQIQPHNWGDQEDAFFVDSGLTFDGGAAVTVTGITAADPGVVTAAAHGFSDGDQVEFATVGGMTEVNGKVFTVSSSATNTFALKDETNSFDWDTSGYTAYTSGGTVQKVEKTFTGLGHLEGETVQVLADAYVHPTCIVANGKITLNDWFNVVHAGKGYTSQLTTMDIDWLMKSGTTLGRKKRITDLVLDFFKTGNCKYGRDADNLIGIDFRTEDDTADVPTPLYTGLKQVDFNDEFTRNASVTVVQDDPLPLTVRALIPTVEID